MNRLKVFLLTLTVLICTVHVTAGNVDSTAFSTFIPKTNVKLNTMVCIGVINPAVELRISKKFSAQIEALGIMATDNFIGTNYPLQLCACFIEPRWYTKRIFNGLFLGANLGCGTFRLNKNILYKFFGWFPDLNYKKNENSIQIGTTLMAGITLGYAYSFKCNPHWAVEANFSFGRQWAVYEEYTHNNNGQISYLPKNGSAEYMPFYRGGIYISYKW